MTRKTIAEWRANGSAEENERDFQYELLPAITIIFANKSGTRLAGFGTAPQETGNFAISLDWKMSVILFRTLLFERIANDIFTSDVIAHQSPSHT